MRQRGSRRTVWNEGRALSPVIGTVLLVGIVVVGIGAFMAAGGSSIQNSKDSVSQESVEFELTKISEEAKSVIFGSNSQVTISLDVESASGQQIYTMNESRSSMTVTVGGAEVYDGQLGTLVYESGETSYGYQAGGVFKISDGGNGRVVDEPPITFANDSAPTLTFPIVVLNGDTAPRRSVSVERTDIFDIHSPPDVAAAETVEIEIESEFAPAWKRYYNESIGLPESQITVGPNRETVTVEFDWSEDGFAHITQRELAVGD